MSDEEMKELSRKIQDAINDAIASRAINWQTSPLQSGSFTTSAIPSNYPAQFGNPGISPTDKNAKGRFPYQEPEQDEQGTYYGYKVLAACHCGCGRLTSPRYPADWNNGELQADHEPSENTMFGIHCTKRPDHPELQNYNNGGYGHSSGYYGFIDNSILVQCALSGTIVETEQGFRAEHAQIVGVLENGHWQSYQDYQERTAANSRRNSKEETYRRYTKGWDTYNFTWDIDPKA